MAVKKSSFGERLRSERARLGFTQTAFAEVAGIKRTAQHFYETDARVPDVRYLENILDAGVDLQYLMRGDQDPTSGASSFAQHPAEERRTQRSKVRQNASAAKLTLTAGQISALKELLEPRRSESSKKQRVGPTHQDEVTDYQLRAVEKVLASASLIGTLHLRAAGGKTIALLDAVEEVIQDESGSKVQAILVLTERK
jgi:transcriptional regulator with XRE-family HTH domain